MPRTPSVKFGLYWSERRKEWDLVVTTPSSATYTIAVQTSVEMDRVNVRLVAGALAREIERLVL